VQDGSGAQVAFSTFTIVNNDTSTETYSISPGQAAVNENAGTLTFTITRSDTTQQETVLVSTLQDQGFYNAVSGTTSTITFMTG
jgi:hypothetical protein